MITRLCDKRTRERAPGVQMTVMGCTDKMMVVEFAMVRGTAVKPHQHPHEQISYVVQGKVAYYDGQGTRFVLEAGECCAFESEQPHGAKALTDAVIVDTFSPPREDFV